MHPVHPRRRAPTPAPAGIVGVTREKVRTRSRELARTAGRAPSEVTQGDYETARRELTGESDFDVQEAILVRAAGN